MTERELVQAWNDGATVRELAAQQGQPLEAVEAALAAALRGLDLRTRGAEERVQQL